MKSWSEVSYPMAGQIGAACYACNLTHPLRERSSWGGGPFAKANGGGAMRATGRSMRVSRQQRRNMSLPEVKLWGLLRRSPGGVKFKRQYAVGPYVADFYCPAAK